MSMSVDLKDVNLYHSTTSDKGCRPGEIEAIFPMDFVWERIR